MTINKNITIQGKTKDKVILDAQGLSRIFTINAGLNVTFINLTFKNGYSSNGGAIYSNSQLTVMNCTFINNTATGNGGAISILGNGVNSIISYSNFINNTASDNSTGATGISTGGGAISIGSTNSTISYNNFINNTSPDSYGNSGGGAIFVYSASTNTTISYNNFINNSCPSGGAITAYTRSIIIYNNFTGNINTNSSRQGGAIELWYSGHIISYNNFINNTAAARGGAVFNYGNNTISYNNFTNNRALGSSGGAIYGQITSGSEITNNIFINNSANTTGGAIFNSNPNATISYNSFINNTANTDGGAIHNANSDVAISYNSFINNTANRSGGAIHSSNSNITISYNSFINNAANNNGGAIQMGAIDSTIHNNNFTNNTANNGGAIYNGVNNVTVDNNSFTNNSANANGGAIYNNNGMSISNNTMSANVAGLGQMIYNTGRIGVLNLTFINNSTWVLINGSNITLFAILTDDMGNTVTGRNILFYINGVQYGSITSIEGLAEINYTAIGEDGDLIPINGSYNGIGDYDIIINAGQLRIVKIASNSTINAKNITIGKSVTIYGVARDEDGNILANTQLTITISGKTYTVTTNNAGEWTLTHTPTKVGNFDVSVTWAGNGTHYGFTNTTKFNVAKRNIIVTITVTENKDGSITIIANATYEDDGSPASDYPVDFILDGKIIGTGITDENGIATLTIPANKISDGPHTITVIVDGGETANNVTASTEFTKTSPNNETNETNKTSNNPAAIAAMKETGMPIIPILLVLISIIGIGIRKKQN